MSTYRDIIRSWPSTRELATDVGAQTKTVRQWHFRDRIPSSFWTRVAEAAERRGIDGATVEHLAALASEDAAGQRAA